MSGITRAEAQAAYPPLCLLIGGTWIGADDRETQPVFDPATGARLGSVPMATTDDVEAAIAAAADSFDRWRRTPAAERSRLLRSAAAHIGSRRSTIAGLIALELGKPLAEAHREVDLAGEMFEWAAEEARRLYGRIIPPRGAELRVSTVREPVGPAGAVSGWNAPAVTPARKLAYALAAGCTVVLKPSEATPAVAQALVAALCDVGVPEGVVNMVFGDPAGVVGQMADHPALRVFSFTGGTEIGRQLSARAALTLKRTVFELGGHAPVLVCDDVDVEALALGAVAAKFRNAGQVCVSPTRFLVAQPVYQRFADAFTAAAAALRVGDPFSPETQMGPVQNRRRIDACDALVADARARGAALLTGGEALERNGTWYSPTVLADVPADARIVNEEPFGPVAVLNAFDSIGEAIAEANRLPFGLAAYAATNDLRIAERLARDVEAGTLAINHWAASFPETPFGGVKQSGIGREGGSEGVDAFLQTRLISVAA